VTGRGPASWCSGCCPGPLPVVTAATWVGDGVHGGGPPISWLTTWPVGDSEAGWIEQSNIDFCMCSGMVVVSDWVSGQLTIAEPLHALGAAGSLLAEAGLQAVVCQGWC
jgi:hypothetical protein